MASSEYVERLTAGELMRIAKVHLLYLEKDRERSRRYYQRNAEARKATNLERYHRKAPAGGAAAAAPEGGALAGPSAPTSTSTRWALVTP